MAKRGNKKLTTYAILGAGALAVGGIVYYALSSGMLAGGTPEEPVPTAPQAPAAPQVIPGITDYPTLTDTLNAPAPTTPTPTPARTPKPVTTVTPTPAPKCPTGWTGVYPDCNPPPPKYNCPAGWSGNYPNCVPPSPQYKCPTGWTGEYPNCNPPTTNVPTCPTGWTGAYPNCIPPSPTYTCPAGWTGTYPNCVPPPPVYQCPVGWTGTYPNCAPPQTTTPPPPPPPTTSTCVRNASLCSSKYYGKCNTECQNPTSSVCKACRCACEGVSSSLALAFAGSRVSDDGVEDRTYYVTAVDRW